MIFLLQTIQFETQNSRTRLLIKILLRKYANGHRICMMFISIPIIEKISRAKHRIKYEIEYVCIQKSLQILLCI